MLGGRPSAADSRESAAEGLPPSIKPKFELSKVEETPTSVPNVFSGEYTTSIKISGPIPLGNPKS